MEEKKWKHVHGGSGGAVYGMGVVGALFYTLQHAKGLEQIVIGILESLFWPALLVYKAFELLRI